MAMSGMLCDLCGIRIPELRLDADLETKNQVLRVEVDLCCVCSRRADPKVRRIYSHKPYVMPGATK